MGFDLSKLLEAMRGGSEIHYGDLYTVCEHFFGPARNTGSSHNIFKTPWIGDPRINIQNDKGKAKPYQVRQVLAAIDKLAAMKAAEAAKKAAQAKTKKK